MFYVIDFKLRFELTHTSNTDVELMSPLALRLFRLDLVPGR